MLLRIRMLLVPALLVAVATVVDVQARPAIAAAGEVCAPNSSATQVMSVPGACVDGIRTLSSRGYITPRCITDAKALEQKAEYKRSECYGAREDGNGPIFAEAIAQARLVAQLNAAGVYGLSVPHGEGITPGVQWEPNFPNPKPNRISYAYVKLD